MDSGIFLFLVSGSATVRAPEVMAMAAKMTVGIAGWMSARAATVVESVPPTLETREDDPTPAALTVVGISSPVYMYRMAKQRVVEKFPMNMGVYSSKSTKEGGGVETYKGFGGLFGEEYKNLQ